MKQATRSRIGHALSYAVLLGAAFVSLFPLFWTLSTSIKTRNDTFVLPPKFFNFEATWKNYIAIFDTRGFGQIYLNTVLITLAYGSTHSCIVVSALTSGGMISSSMSCVSP